MPYRDIEDRKNQVKRWRLNNPDKRKIQRDKYWAKHPDKRKAHVTKFRNSRRGALGTYSVQEWENLCKFWGNICLACGIADNLSVDHIIPISKGGLNIIDNIQPLCTFCNSTKYTQTINYREAV